MGIILNVLLSLLSLYEIVILLRCIMSLFQNPYSKVYQFLYKVTEPLLGPIRALLSRTPLGGMMLDFSPVVAILLIGVVERCLTLLIRIVF